MKTVITIEPVTFGFKYRFSKPIGIEGFSPTKEGLAEIIGKTITEYIKDPQAPERVSDILAATDYKPLGE